MKYRSEIDGLRALAVVPVILFHAHVELFAGGFVGVDIFFVISGYLITSIIAAEIAVGEFSIARFYERRARRILPLLFFVILCSLPFAWLWFMPRDMKDFAQSVGTAAVFISNFHFWLESGYFDTAAELKPLLHTWSLAVEEQYYIFFPLLLIAAWKLSTRGIALLFVAIFVASLAWAQWAITQLPMAAFYLLPARGWELLLGAGCAFYLRGTPRTLPPAIVNALSVLGLAMIVASIFIYDRNTPFPGLYGLLPTLGTVLIILFATRGTLAYGLLSHRAFVGVGLISYGAYLWHQPVLAFYRYRFNMSPTVVEVALLVCLTFALAVLTWRYVEAPFRDRRRTRFRPIVKALSACALFFVAFAFTGQHTDGMVWRLPEDIHRVVTMHDDWRDRDACAFSGTVVIADVSDCYEPGNTVYLIGDSHAQSISKTMREMVEENGHSFISWGLKGCFPFPGTSRKPWQDDCVAYKEQFYAFLKDHPGDIVISTRWRLNLEGIGYDNGEGGLEYISGQKNYVVSDESRDIFDHTEAELSRLVGAHQVVLIDQIPEAGWDVPNEMGKAILLGEETSDVLSTSFDAYRTQNRNITDLVSKFEDRARVIRTAPLVCDRESERCLNELDGVPLYRDDDHPSPLLGRMIADKVHSALFDGES